MAAQPAKTVTVAALAGAAFAVAYKTTSKYLSNDEDETPKSLDDSTKLDESTASSFYGITPSSLATRHEARSMDREKSERSLRLMVESKALAQASTTDYAGGTLGSRVKLVVAMVGLPARGKSYLVKMLVRYLSWVGFPTKIFNVGELRRKQGQAGAKAEYFADTPEAMAVREGLALQCQEEMYDWLRAQKGACVAIFDATNTTRHRRHLLTERCKAESDESGNDVSIVFVESICDDPKVLSRNYEMKLQNADYRGTDPKKAMADFMERVKQYEARYEPVDDAEECAYIKLVNVGDKVITRRCGGYLTSQLGFYLGNVHIQPRRIWLALHGESQLQVESRRVGAATGHLTPRGRCFARRLASFVKDAHASFREEHVDTDPEIVVLTGNAPIHSQTIKPLLADPLAFEAAPRVSTSSLLNELCGGDFDGLSVKEIQDRYPAVWHRRMADKLRFRYPGAGGESYLDVINRLRPILIELERQRKSVLLVTHLAVQRCLYSYFTGTDAEAIPYLPLPAGAVLELTPTPHGTQVRTHILLPDDEEAPTRRLRRSARLTGRRPHRSPSTASRRP
ncbi:unnamed protein product [Pelagomonas calceolata]|uniref:6-phosphofructo-2-kinase domain-containing protein n=1 Tax=Pelagomonas calceolata TaxID=35677 RepID=A0A8J2SEQ4_9STRA|nr:unnamed protein product [Pelagomonas calceolata]